MAKYQLTKSNLLYFRQCPKRLYLSVHQPELAEFDPATQQRFDQGHLVGAVAREVYGPGDMINFDGDPTPSVERTRELIMRPGAVVFEATFLHDGVMVRNDVLRVGDDGGLNIMEVKQASSVKKTYPDDCAIQAWVVEQSGHNVASFALTHVNTEFLYKGDRNYSGLFTPVPLDKEIRDLRAKVPGWVAEAKGVIGAERAPALTVGSHCKDPYPCPFYEHCNVDETEYPVKKLPYVGKLAAKLEGEGFKDIRDIPDGRLEKPLHEKIRRVTISGKAELDPAAGEAVRTLPYPRHYLDFETISPAVPMWAGTNPYQQIPFQWSIHTEQADASLSHRSFLDVSGDFPARPCAEQLLQTLGEVGPILVYTSFEGTVLGTLAELLPDLAPRIAMIKARLVDLHPIMRDHYYHPDMKCSWSIKKVLPTIAPDLDYAGLGDLADGEAAQRAFLKLIDSSFDAAAKNELKPRLLRYCEYDTLAMVRIARFLASQPAPS